MLHSSPLLPTAPAGHGQEQLHYLIRYVLEDLAVVGQIDEQARFDMLSAVDAIPVTYRAELGAVPVIQTERPAETDLLVEWGDLAANVSSRPAGVPLWFKGARSRQRRMRSQ